MNYSQLIHDIAKGHADILRSGIEVGEQSAKSEIERLRTVNADLLEALRWMRSCFDEHGELRETYDDQCSVSLEKADAAIAKAEGR